MDLDERNDYNKNLMYLLAQSKEFQRTLISLDRVVASYNISTIFNRVLARFGARLDQFRQGLPAEPKEARTTTGGYSIR